MSTSAPEERQRRIRSKPRKVGEDAHPARAWILALGGLSGIAAMGTLLFQLTPDKTPPPSSPININLSNIGSGNANSANNSTNNSTTSSSTSHNTQPNTANVAQRPVAPPQRVISDYEKFINSNAHRVADAMNVAIALRGLPGHPARNLEGAVQSALRGRGFAIVPVFREPFQKEGLQRLFDGDATLASRLKLKEHCDSVLVGMLRFAGPAQQVDGELYIREAVLEIRAIDPASGRIIDSLEISEKGGGASAELSSVNALDQLKEKVEANISGWSWV